VKEDAIAAELPTPLRLTIIEETKIEMKKIMQDDLER
jgi:hypothetical protein